MFSHICSLASTMVGVRAPRKLANTADQGAAACGSETTGVTGPCRQRPREGGVSVGEGRAVHPGPLRLCRRPASRAGVSPQGRALQAVGFAWSSVSPVAPSRTREFVSSSVALRRAPGVRLCGSLRMWEAVLCFCDVFGFLGFLFFVGCCFFSSENANFLCCCQGSFPRC